MLQHRKKRPLERNEATRDARLFVIATEGERTEEIYFGIFRSTRVKVKVICSQGGRSAPRYVFQNMDSFRQEYDLDADDELWLAIDRDSWTPKEMSTIAASCQKKGFNLAVSNPCFELWLAHHFEDELPNPLTCQTLIVHLKRIMSGFSKSSYKAEPLYERLELAVANAVKLDAIQSRRWPHPNGTRIHALVTSLLNAT